jgi:iron-sulfur cluster repair protein YtfE (RIC family)
VAATLERRGLAAQYLAEETPCRVEFAAPAMASASDAKRWMDEHAQIRARLQDWETALQRLSAYGGRAAERQAADACLRESLEYFKAVLATHCRREESESFPAVLQDADGAAKLTALRAEHERFGVDLDKFERQMVSYGLSKDPTVLLTLGSRMIREMRAHLEAEEQLLP